jgi:2,3-bisphosphoglycerate-independent phosphoglycerate mutase
MNLPQLTARLTEDLRARRHDVVICNIANPDMVGHSGILAAAVQAAEAVDVTLGAIRAALEAAGGEMIVTADHGNLEMMRDPDTGQPHTSHTVGPVPLVYVGRAATLRAGGALRDIAPTVLDLLGLAKPAEMTGRSLVTLE